MMTGMDGVMEMWRREGAGAEHGEPLADGSVRWMLARMFAVVARGDATTAELDAAIVQHACLLRKLQIGRDLDNLRVLGRVSPEMRLKVLDARLLCLEAEGVMDWLLRDRGRAITAEAVA